MTVLVLAQDFDRTADHVVRELTVGGVPVLRVDLSWFPQRLSIDAELREGRWTGRLCTPHRQVALEDIRSIWHRSPAAFDLPVGMSTPERVHAHREGKIGLGGVLASLPVLWANHPGRSADAVYKPLQLAVAAGCGLRVPRTLISNSAAAAHRFADQSATGAVIKMLGAGTIHEDHSRKVSFTHRLTGGDLDDLAGFDVTCHQMQDWVPKSREARVVVIGETLFTVGIHAGSAASHVDWRSDHSAVDYERLEPPGEVTAGIGRLMVRLGLVYGALDFVIGPDGSWTFLEINPGGQFGWLQLHTGLPMTATLAGLLAAGATT